MSATESAASRHQMAATLQAGLRVLDENQTILFTRYNRFVLPIDGSVFWVRDGLVAESAKYNAARFNQAAYNQTQVSSAASTFRASGSIHYMTSASQQEADSATVNQIVFTSERQIEDMNEVGPEVMYLGTWQGVRFSFSRREMFFEQARLWHYAGQAVLATMETQIIDSLAGFDLSAVVSDSLPIWLAMRNPYIPVIGLSGISFPLLPSFLVTSNLEPPFVAIHIRQETTMAVSSAPAFDATMSQEQLIKETVRMTTYGLRNRQVLDLIRYVQSYCQCSEAMGISNMPVPRDEKQAQVELGVLAQKKTIEFEVNYLQSMARDETRQLILAATILCTPVPPVLIDPAEWNEFRWNNGATWT